MNAVSFVLALIDASGGTISGRTLLQKRAFFSSLLSGIDPGLSFDAHYYGPYSSTVDSLIIQLKNLGFIEERDMNFGAMSGGFEIKRYDYSLTKDGEAVLEVIRTADEYRRVAEAVKAIQKAGDPNYVVLSIAAKTYFILSKHNRPMSTTEIHKEAEKLNWNIQPSSLENAVTFLRKLGVAQEA